MIDTDKYERMLKDETYRLDGRNNMMALTLLAEVKRLNMVINMLKKNDLWVSQEGWEESDKDDELLVSMNYLIQGFQGLRGVFDNVDISD